MKKTLKLEPKDTMYCRQLFLHITIAIVLALIIGFLLMAVGSAIETIVVNRMGDKVKIGGESTSYVEIYPTADAENLPKSKPIVLSPIEGGTSSHYYVSIAGSDDVAEFLRFGVNTNFAYGDDGWHRYQTVPIHSIGDGFAISDAIDLGDLPEGSEVEFSLSCWVDEDALAANEDYDGENFSIGVIFESDGSDREDKN